MSACTDTIVAISSPPGRSTRGLLRLSGPKTGNVLDSLLGTHTHKVTEDRHLRPGRIRWDRHHDTLPVLVARFNGPRSYTGQDMAEIQCPGHPALLDRLIHRTIDLGARLADPGEFTFRAFMVGKMDLTRAEGVAAMISATSDGQLQAARLLRDGHLGQLAEQLVAKLGDQLALVEAGIDFTDQEDVVPVTRRELATTLAQVSDQLNELLTGSRPWGTLEALPRVVLAGAASSGKSTLFNALLARPRAVVSSTPGTTRDVLAEPLLLTSAQGNPIEVMLVDVAGLDEPNAALDQIAVAVARRAHEHADLILYLDDGRTAEPADPPPDMGACPTIKIHSKMDLRDRMPRRADVAISAHTGAGLQQLRCLIVDHIGEAAVSVSAGMLALQPRHDAAMRAALDYVLESCRLLEKQKPTRVIANVELVASTIRTALDELAGLGGALTPDDVIGRIFSKFCIGK